MAKIFTSSTQVLKNMLRKLIPESIIQISRNRVNSGLKREFKDLSLKDSFTKIYTEQQWGRSGTPDDSFFSGSGSHENAVVSPYTTAIERFLSAFDTKPNVVDLGCGDFSIGSRIRHLCDRYVACDIVESLITRNRRKFDSAFVDFRVLDITMDELPNGDVVFIRQVLQHLSNDQITKVLPKISSTFKYLVLTEHLPRSKSFVPNIDKPAGPHIRVGVVAGGSGVILTRPPFNLRVKTDTILCSVVEGAGIIQTNLYELA